MERQFSTMKRVSFVIVFLLFFSLAACAGNGSTSGGTGDDPAARAVEDYLSAKVRGEADEIRAGLCSEMEADLERETRTFESVSNASIDNMSCASDDPNAEDETAVRCSGEIVALYGTEENVFPLVSYRVVEEDGEWKYCGEG